jgi:uncharacterized protein YjbI with pentapeptide repeats
VERLWSERGISCCVVQCHSGKKAERLWQTKNTSRSFGKESPHGNDWRERNPGVEPDLWQANLFETNLSRANLFEANLGGAELGRANLRGAYLSGANLIDADPTKANLMGAQLIETDLFRGDAQGKPCLWRVGMGHHGR